MRYGSKSKGKGKLAKATTKKKHSGKPSGCMKPCSPSARSAPRY